MRKENRAAAGAAAWQVIQNTDGNISVWQRAGAVPRMMWAKVRGRYPEMSAAKMLGMIALTLYIVSPIDFVPELFVPLLGLTDDVGAAVWLTTMLLGESERFLRKERDERAQQAFSQANAGWQGARGQAGPGAGAQGSGVPPQGAEAGRTAPRREPGKAPR
ncbi:YkvA family protein [Nocardiopsis sp. NPDC006139]|uniref:YkvA family protein n=1 Tax=Nocardiopsis TaxID=2013 RepID=UPI0033B493F2